MRTLTAALIAASLTSIGLAQSADLVQVYHQAVKSDPTFQQAYATYQAAREQVPINRAALLPQVSLALTGTVDREKTVAKNGSSSIGITPGSVTAHQDSRDSNYTLSVAQTVFNFTQWEQLESASASEKSAFATYTAAIQNLIVRTSTAYFEVLRARDDLILAQSEKRAFYRQYRQAKESYDVGVKTLTDVENAQAQYDSSKSKVVQAENNLLDQRENLRAITNVYYSSLQSLKRLPLLKPSPSTMNAWVKKAQKSSWSLKASQFDLVAAGYNVKAAEGGHMPTVALNASYENDYTRNLSVSDSNQRTTTAQAGLTLTMPIFQGGQVYATVNQNVDQYRLAAAQLEYNYRDILNQTRQSYLGAMSGISKVQADYQAIISNQSSLQGTEEGYKVGTQTMLDVLQAEKNLYQAQENYSNDRYDYILSLINLKAAAGTLSVNDVNRINQWLLATAPNVHASSQYGSLKTHYPHKKMMKKHSSKPAPKKAVHKPQAVNHKVAAMQAVSKPVGTQNTATMPAATPETTSTNATPAATSPASQTGVNSSNVANAN